MGNEIKETNINMENLEVGEDKPQITAKRVVIESYKIEDVNSKEGKAIGKKLILSVKHPDVPDKNLEISSVTYMKEKKLTTSGIWMNVDADGKIPFKSALANMLRSLGVAKISGLKDARVDTVADDNGYLTVKAY